MSQELINRSPDLKQLQDEGYEIQVIDGYLLLKHVPYVNDKKEVAYGMLVSALTLSADSTVKPNDHVVLWTGDFPCNATGTQLTSLVNQSQTKTIKEGLVIKHSFSHKPHEGYRDFYQKMTSYVHILENHAKVLDSKVTAQTFAPISLSEEESVFCYVDSASSRAGITSINEKLKQNSIAIVGLGGTGSYILDLVAKTPVGEIHIFDDDKFYQHNAFRSPGAPSLDDLSKNLTKVEWFSQIYSKMRRKIIPHKQLINKSNISELDSMDTVFLCIDKGKSKRVIVEHLIAKNIPIIDVGIDIINESEALTGSARVTTCTPSYHKHVETRMNFTDQEDDEYSTNIQIADMNALNAALAVIKWKKMCGFYHYLGQEHHAVYSISTNSLTNDEVSHEEKDYSV